MNDIGILSNENALFVIITIINIDYICPNKKEHMSWHMFFLDIVTFYILLKAPEVVEQTKSGNTLMEMVTVNTWCTYHE